MAETNSIEKKKRKIGATTEKGISPLPSKRNVPLDNMRSAEGRGRKGDQGEERPSLARLTGVYIKCGELREKAKNGVKYEFCTTPPRLMVLNLARERKKQEEGGGKQPLLQSDEYSGVKKT